jgi:hypothetical protein
MDASHVRHVLFYVPLHPGNLILAEMEDGRLCILQNDVVVDGCRWTMAEMGEAVAHFQRMKAELKKPAPH